MVVLIDMGCDYDLGLDIGITRKQISDCEYQVNSLDQNAFMSLVRNLNEKQRTFFYHVLHKVKNDSLPFYCFLTGGAGVGKSIVTTSLYQAVTRYYSKCLSMCTDEIKAVKLKLCFVLLLGKQLTISVVIQYIHCFVFLLTKICNTNH